ncbi:MAG: thioredoxin domain-containing protein [Sphingomonas fennica]
MMIPARLSAAAMAALALLAGCGDKSAPVVADQPVAAVAPPAGTEWTDRIEKTAEGGYRMGNPAAPVKLVEYAAYTCPHCRDFAAAANQPLRDDFVKTGRVSWEYRPFLLSGADVAPALLAQCQGPGAFFSLTEEVFANQSAWTAPLIAMNDAERQRLSALAPAQQFRAMGETMGLPAFFRQRGLTQAQIDKCLSDGKAADALADATKRAVEEDKVTGTPAFLINGRLQEDVLEWPALRAKLNAATGA